MCKTIGCLIGILFSLAMAHAQNCTPMPVGEKDGVLIAPQAHKSIYEDADVRVVEVNVAPHSRDAYHTHLRPSVFLMLEDVHYKIYAPPELGGRVKTPPVAPKPTAFNFKPEAPHSVENLDDVRQYAMRIELKHPGCGPVTAAVPASDDALAVAPSIYTLAFETDDVRVLEITLPPQTTAPAHTEVWPAIVYADRPASQQTKLTRVQPRSTYVDSNNSNETYHAFRVELKRALPAESH